MDKKYIELFRNLAQATAASAEQIMAYDREKNDEEGLKTATIMRDDFQELASNIREKGENYSPNKEAITRLMVGAIIQINQIQNRIYNLQQAMTGYQTDVMPKLQEILDNAKTDEEVAKLADEKFIIEEGK